MATNGVRAEEGPLEISREAPAGPRKERFESLDALRGFAILGILMVNIEMFAGAHFEFQNPAVLEPLTGADATAWSVMYAFFQFKFITIFSALFGAGLVLFAGEEPMSPKRPLLRRRLLWLLLFGMIHNYVIWYGDILVPYAVAGLIGAVGRRWSARTLVLASIPLLLVTFGLFALQGLGFSMMKSMDPAKYATMIETQWAPPAEVIEGLHAALGGGLGERFAALLPLSAMFQLFQTVFFAPRTIAVMWIGMALLKSGFLTARWPLWSYAVVALLAPAGAWLTWGAAQDLIAVQFEPIATSSGMLTVYWASLFQALGYVAIVMVLVKLPFGLLLHPFKAAGRMAFSNYILCSLVCVFVFWGTPGLGLIGTFSHVEQAQFVLVMWAVMLVWSTAWLAMFRIGPLEWLWRTLTYKRALPMRRSVPIPGG